MAIILEMTIVFAVFGWIFPQFFCCRGHGFVPRKRFQPTWSVAFSRFAGFSKRRAPRAAPRVCTVSLSKKKTPGNLEVFGSFCLLVMKRYEKLIGSMYGIFTCMKTIQINDSCRLIYTSPMDPMVLAFFWVNSQKINNLPTKTIQNQSYHIWSFSVFSAMILVTWLGSWLLTPYMVVVLARGIPSNHKPLKTP